MNPTQAIVLVSSQAHPVVAYGLTAGGVFVPMRVDASGNMSATIAEPAVTQNFQALAASSSQVIPAGAKGWTATILTGTGTIGGIAVSAGFSDSDVNTLVNTLTVATNAASTAYVRWGT